MFRREARAPVGQAVQGLGNHGLQGMKVVDDDVAIADALLAIVVFLVQVGVHRRPDRAGDLVCNHYSGIDAEFLYLLEVVSVVGIMPSPSLQEVLW